MHLEQFSSSMGPARGMLDPRGLAWCRSIQGVVAGESIGMHHAAEPGQVFARPLAFSVGRVAVECRRRPGSGMRSGIHGIDPEPRQPGLARAGCERADRRVVGVQHRLRHHGRADQLGKRRQPPGSSADPISQRHAVDLHALAGQNDRLAEQRQAVAVFRDRDMSDQPRPGPAALDRQVGRRCLEDRLAHAARIAGPDVPNKLQPGRDLLQDLGRVLAQPGQSAPVAAAAHQFGFMHHGLARQMIGQRSADGFGAGPGLSIS